jgi:hypothetical protein
MSDFGTGSKRVVILRKLVGYLLILAAAAGFIFSIVGQIVLWHYQPVITRTVMDTLALVDQTLNTTQEGLLVVNQIVQTTAVDVASLQVTTQALAKTLHETNPMLDSLTNLIGKEFPAAVLATQNALASAQSSALLIDNVLSALTSIPLLPITPYTPEVPLHTSLAQVSASLDALPPALATINSSLVAGKTNLGAVEVELSKISDTTQGISAALGGAQEVIDQYKTVTIQLRTRIEAVQLAAPGWMIAITLVLSFLLVWLLIAQLGLFMQGLGILWSLPVGKNQASMDASAGQFDNETPGLPE